MTLQRLHQIRLGFCYGRQFVHLQLQSFRLLLERSNLRAKSGSLKPVLRSSHRFSAIFLRNLHFLGVWLGLSHLDLIVVTQRLLNSFALLLRDNQIHISLGDFEIVSNQLLGDVIVIA